MGQQDFAFHEAVVGIKINFLICPIKSESEQIIGDLQVHSGLWGVAEDTAKMDYRKPYRKKAIVI